MSFEKKLIAWNDLKNTIPRADQSAMGIEKDDFYWMAKAIRLAEKGLYTTSPNPRVGCVLVLNEQLVGSGWHAWAGQAHAEVNALADAGEHSVGATAYVTLEPCQHTGRTGPCCEALLQAGVARVVFGMQDPNPLVSGGGLAKLRAGGVVVDGPVLQADCEVLNPGFVKRMTQGLPYVRCKLAMSLDGRTAMASGESQWITGPEARADVQRLRARSCAVVTGIDTVLQDNARLSVRSAELNGGDIRQPLRVVLDSQGRASGDEAFFKQSAPCWWVTGPTVSRQLAAPACEHKVLPVGTDGRIDLSALLQALAAEQVNEVLVEAGPTLAASFAAQKLLDEVIVYMAPTLMGSQARPLLQLPFDKMSQQQRLAIADVRAVGRDWRFTAKLEQ